MMLRTQAATLRDVPSQALMRVSAVRREACRLPAAARRLALHLRFRRRLQQLLDQLDGRSQWHLWLRQRQRRARGSR